MKKDNNGKYFFGNVREHLQENGWFFGHFMKDSLLHSDDVEVAWQDISNKKAEPADHHIHKIAVELNILIHGWVSLEINNNPLKVEKQGDSWIVWPGAIVDKVEAGPDTQIICIKAPSVPGDKYYL